MNTLMQINFRSEVLLLHDSMNVILPDDRKPGSNASCWLQPLLQHVLGSRLL